MRRIVEPEILDDLPPLDPRAVGSRGDLRKLNIILKHEVLMARAIGPRPAESPLRVLELGAGDGTFLLRLARQMAKHGVKANVTLVDRLELVAAETRGALATLGWQTDVVTKDVLAWLEEPFPPVDIMAANLFLHHFADDALAVLLRLAAARTNLFIACETRRSPFALAISKCLRVIGCNDVTRHDAPASVRAGFEGSELSDLWPRGQRWELAERPAGLFSHYFVARKNG